MAKQEIEMRLMKACEEQIQNWMDQVRVMRESQSTAKSYLQKGKQNVAMLGKQILEYKRLFPNDDQILYWESRLYVFQAIVKQYSGLYDELYPGWFSSGAESAARDGIQLLDKALAIHEDPRTRLIKIAFYRMLKDRKLALQEIDYILEHYADNEDVYMTAKKDKLELETEKKGFFGSLFG